jgi:hypothetical protein
MLMAVSDSRMQFLLAQSPVFQSRVQINMTKVANDVIGEAGTVPSHAQRAQYARQVLSNPAYAAQQNAGLLAQSGNVAPTITLEDDGANTSVTDGALFAQVNSLWNVMAGVTESVPVEPEA